ncbi:pyridoxal phosphate-dependent decarboxylase family protein [Brevibacterium antiquum]|uniref:Glutamate or tyrosine decarboxylase n=1 Tax=Brevibacterium antiquum TaxID=234835 RepID=A0A2H1JZS9_9MICO|nr:aminotransferase class V-fold PLP-dependent enzyme [Brevibacterium antiquum]SMX93047.1 Glutamate or tyrosine decarboxylase [Brevibacterium antiquum]
MPDDAGVNRGESQVGPDAKSAEILDRLKSMRQQDAPTHGGRVLSYVYDPGSDILDELAGKAMELARPLNGLDPTTFPSIARMEKELTRFAIGLTGGRVGKIFGSVTSGGTESCLLAVKTARDLWRSAHPDSAVRPRLLTSTTVHAAFQKAAVAFDLDWDPVPVGPDGRVRARDVLDRLGDDVALVVLSAPAYPTGAIDPIAEVARRTRERGIALHVDACFGGLALPWWGTDEQWDFSIPGVTSISADFHKFGYAPKGVSVLMHRGRRRHRAQFFATSSWPAYPVVNPTLLGSKSASPLAAAWAIVSYLGQEGYAEAVASCRKSTAAIIAAVDGIDGLQIWGQPTGPALALIADTSLPTARRVDPHRLADAAVAAGFRLQHQPGFTQSDGTRLPRSVHLTITPVTEIVLPELLTTVSQAADRVRGRRPHNAKLAGRLARMLYPSPKRPGPGVCAMLLRLSGAGSGVPGKMAGLMALIEALPAPVTEALLTELLARTSED